MENKITIGAIGLLVIAQVIVIGVLWNLSGRVAEISTLGSRDLSTFGVTPPSGGGNWTGVDNLYTGDLFNVSSTTHTGTTTFGDGIRMGDDVGVLKMLKGTCNSTFDGTTLAASSTGRFLCDVTGVVEDDLIFVSLPMAAGAGASSTASTTKMLGFWINGAEATTSDVFGYSMSNGTGGATTTFAHATTAVQYWIIR